MEYLDGCSTIIRHVVRKVATVEGGLVCLEMTSPQGCNFQMGGLAYDTSPIITLKKSTFLTFYLHFSNFI